MAKPLTAINVFICVFLHRLVVPHVQAEMQELGPDRIFILFRHFHLIVECSTMGHAAVLSETYRKTSWRISQENGMSLRSNFYLPTL